MKGKFVQKLQNWIVRLDKKGIALFNHLTSGDLKSKYIYVSHHKCATQYTLKILRDVSTKTHIPTVKCDWRENISKRTLLFNKFIMIQDYASSIIDLESIKGRGFHVIRDPRDILVSMYFSHKDSHVVRDPKAKEILENRSVLNRLDKEAGLIYLIENSMYLSRVLTEMENWDYERENFYESRFEQLTQKPLDEFQRIFHFLGLQVKDVDLERIIEKYSFKKLKENWLQHHPEAKKSHYRRGKSGDWKKHLQGEAKNWFKKEYGELLIKLNYERDLSW